MATNYPTGVLNQAIAVWGGDGSVAVDVPVSPLGTSVMDVADEVALRALAGLGSAAVANTGDFDAAGAAAAAYAAAQAYFIANTYGVMMSTIDGGGAVPAVGRYDLMQAPYDCTIQSVTLVGDVSGSTVIDLLYSTFADIGSGTTICSSTKPTLTSARTVRDTTLTSWSKDLNKGDYLEPSLVSAATLKRVQIFVGIVRR